MSRFFPMPEYDLKDEKVRVEINAKVLDEDFRVIIWRKGTKMNEPQNEPQIQSDKTTYRRCRVLLETIISKPYLTKEDLGKQLSVSESTIKRDIDKLRKTYRITWIGPTIGGRWEVGHK